MNGGELLKLALDFEEGFDFDSSSIYCDSCTMERARIREQLHNVQTAIDKMPLRESAQRFGISQHYCRQLALSGTVKAVRIGRGKILVNCDSMAAFFDSATIPEQKNKAASQHGIVPIPVKI